jgi:CRISPR-associated protein Cas2
MKRAWPTCRPKARCACMTVTEKQYASMKLLVGLPLFQEKKVNAAQIALF